MTLNHEKVILVFKTNVSEKKDAKILLDKILQQFPTHRINFDLEDCDKILRIEGVEIRCEKIITILNMSDYQCSTLE